MLTPVFFVTAILLINATTAYSPCGSGWHLFEGRCYALGHNTVNFADAEELCEIFDATVAEVQTASENMFLKNLMRNESVKQAWLGGTDIFEEGNFVWVSTKQRITEFTDWITGQPDEGGPTHVEDCMAMWEVQDPNYHGYGWNDVGCEAVLNFICEGEPNDGAIVG